MYLMPLDVEKLMGESPNGCEIRDFVEGMSATLTGNGVYAGRGFVWLDVALGLTVIFLGARFSRALYVGNSCLHLHVKSFPVALAEECLSNLWD